MFNAVFLSLERFLTHNRHSRSYLLNIIELFKVETSRVIFFLFFFFSKSQGYNVICVTNDLKIYFFEGDLSG